MVDGTGAFAEIRAGKISRSKSKGQKRNGRISGSSADRHLIVCWKPKKERMYVCLPQVSEAATVSKHGAKGATRGRILGQE